MTVGWEPGYQNYIDSPCICLKRQCKKKKYWKCVCTCVCLIAQIVPKTFKQVP